MKRKLIITDSQLKALKENLIKEEKGNKIIDLNKLKELAKSISFICNGEYGTLYLNEKENKIWVCLGDANPFDEEYLEMFIKEIVATSYKVSDDIEIIIENEATPSDNNYKKIDFN